MLSSLFPGDIGSALSGGYDSRHMTALLLSVGETPHLYVYGDSSSSDVRVAKNIALGERLELDHVDKGALAKVTQQAYWAPLFTYVRNYAYNSDLDFVPTPDEISHFYAASWK